MILTGDIGGTKTLLALFETDGGELQTVHEERYPSEEFRSLEEILTRFLRGRTDVPIRGACFGVAGPVIDGTAETTNLPWDTLSEMSLAAATNVPRVLLINDLSAAALGMLQLKPADFACLQQGQRRPGHVAVVAPGTGLGQSMLYWDGNRHHPIPSEGGHVDFAPRDALQDELLRWLWKLQPGHVSYERVLAGDGLARIHQFLREFRNEPPSVELAARLAGDDPNAVISREGLEGKDRICAETLQLYCSILGAKAGNIALSCLPFGGLYLGGGIPPKIRPALEKHFLPSFLGKGRFQPLLESIPVRIALDSRAPILGAARYLLQTELPPLR